MCGRRPIQRFEMKKAAAGFPARAFQSSCDDRDMPVICPTCQIFSVTADLEHDPEKWVPVFRKDHAQAKR